jgi:hypothetical protein
MIYFHIYLLFISFVLLLFKPFVIKANYSLDYELFPGNFFKYI